MTEPDDIRLVPLAREHLSFLADVVRDPDVLRFTRVPDPPPEDFIEGWFAGYEQGREAGTRDAFAVIHGDGTFLGAAVAPSINRATGTVELGYTIMPEARGRGAATRALGLLTEWAFTTLDAQRIELYISVDNEASKRVAERNGYRYEGTLRSLYFKQGVRADTEIWSKLPSDHRRSAPLIQRFV
jgi:RimJ/RimL family protein N-acetyltransferase